MMGCLTSGWALLAFLVGGVGVMGWLWSDSHQPEQDYSPPPLNASYPSDDTSSGAADARSRLTGDGNSTLLTVTTYEEIPEVDLSKLTDAQRRRVLARANIEKCSCGCGYTIAACRHLDTSCQTSLPMARQIVTEVSGL
jgi:hypothetical protein